jgi:precorrin-3B synthase
MRGLTPVSAPHFAAEVTELAIDICEGIPVIADPLPGDTAASIDTPAFARALRRAIAEAALDLAPKVSVVVDGGGHIDLDALSADVRLRAITTDDGPQFRLAIAGDASSAAQLRAVAPGEAVEAVLDLLKQIAALGPDARGADLLDAPIFAQPDEDPVPRPPRLDAVGLHALRNQATALGIALAFGHAQAESLAELAGIAQSNGAEWARPAPGRTLLLGPFSDAKAMAAREAAGGIDFVVRTDDPRRRIAACPGAPLCVHGLIAARALAAELASKLPFPTGDKIALHVSGCAKGCAHPTRAPLTVVGTEKGCGIIRDGTARSRPTRILPPRDLVSVLTENREVAHA